MIKNDRMYIAVDFDGTVSEDGFPGVGPPVPGAVETLKELHEMGHKIILWTVRSGSYLSDAVLFMHTFGVPLLGVNENPDWTDGESPKVYAQIYIDDKALGSPLVHPADGRKAYVDWDVVRETLGLPPLDRDVVLVHSMDALCAADVSEICSNVKSYENDYNCCKCRKDHSNNTCCSHSHINKTQMRTLPPYVCVSPYPDCGCDPKDKIVAMIEVRKSGTD